MNPDQKERLLNAELLVDHWQGRYERDTALLRQALEELKAENARLRGALAATLAATEAARDDARQLHAALVRMVAQYESEFDHEAHKFRPKWLREALDKGRSEP